MLDLKRLFLVGVFGLYVSPMAAIAGDQLYINQNYAYEVKIPDGVVLLTNAAPAPQHGFAIRLGGRREISVDASYDATLLGSAEAALRDRAADEEIPAATPSTNTHVSGLLARRLHAEGNGSTIILETAYRGENTGSAVIYTFELTTDAGHLQDDVGKFDGLIESFRTTPW